MASGWNLWAWLQCIGVVSRCCCKEVYNYIDILIIIINFPYSTCIRSFFGSSILTSLFIFKCFFGLVSDIFLQYIANVTHRTFEIVKKKSRSREYKINLIIFLIKNVERASTARTRESRDFHVQGTESGLNDV